MNMGEKILELLKKQSKEDWEYFNPNFLTEITQVIEDYYDLRDEDVDEWIDEMYGS
jgi:hypothetical protein